LTARHGAHHRTSSPGRSATSGDINAGYFVVNALILGLGIGLDRLGARLRDRRTGAASVT